ncbi:MAG: hypothetical protein KDJ29_01740, partial [Hyphomicrobiales bacterium]|nr:hypothetical protein [Hyphomicrobiales bacterium]
MKKLPVAPYHGYDDSDSAAAFLSHQRKRPGASCEKVDTGFSHTTMLYSLEIIGFCALRRFHFNAC